MLLSELILIESYIFQLLLLDLPRTSESEDVSYLTISGAGSLFYPVTILNKKKILFALLSNLFFIQCLGSGFCIHHQDNFIDHFGYKRGIGIFLLFCFILY